MEYNWMRITSQPPIACTGPDPAGIEQRRFHVEAEGPRSRASS
jgi:hypothetical protein